MLLISGEDRSHERTCSTCLVTKLLVKAGADRGYTFKTHSCVKKVLLGGNDCPDRDRGERQ